ncbi:Protein AAR2 homolog [Linum perenne]
MDPDTALELVKQGATLLLLDVPQYTLVGVDTQVFTVGPAFKGIKMIPPGIHFLYFSSSNREGKEFSPVIGSFIDAGPSEVIVRRWEQQEERLVKLSEEEAERFAQAVLRLEFDGNLGPYNASQYRDWKQLSNYLARSIIERIEPIGGEITISSESRIYENIPKSSMEKTLDEQLVNNKFSTSTSIDKSTVRGCYYTRIPRTIKHKGIAAKELTSLNLDKTELLESILMKYYGGSEDVLLGELQFSYIAFLMGQSLEGFFQWKSMVTLLLGCVEAPFRTRSRLYTKFIKVIYYQLKFGLQKDREDANSAGVGVSSLLDESWFTADSFLHRLFKEFFTLLQEASVIDGDLLSWSRKLKEMVENELGWELQQSNSADGLYFEEDDEYAPAVVKLEDLSMNGGSGISSLNMTSFLHFHKFHKTVANLADNITGAVLTRAKSSGMSLLLGDGSRETH